MSTLDASIDLTKTLSAAPVDVPVSKVSAPTSKTSDKVSSMSLSSSVSNLFRALATQNQVKHPGVHFLTPVEHEDSTFNFDEIIPASPLLKTLGSRKFIHPIL